MSNIPFDLTSKKILNIVRTAYIDYLIDERNFEDMRLRNNLITKELEGMYKDLRNLEKTYDKVTAEAFNLAGEAQLAKWDEAAELVNEMKELRSEIERLEKC